MQSTKNVQELIQEQQILKSELLRVQDKLATQVVHYEGTLQDALKEGIVRLNFSAPPGFYKELMSNVK